MANLIINNGIITHNQVQSTASIDAQVLADNYLTERRYIIKKDFLNTIFNESRFSGIKIHFGMDTFGQICLILNAVSGSSYESITNDNRYFIIWNSHQYFYDYYPQIDKLTFELLKKEFQSSEYGYVKSYCIGKDKFSNLYTSNNDTLTVRIKGKTISPFSIKKMCYLVLCDSDPFSEKYSTYYDYRLPDYVKPVYINGNIITFQTFEGGSAGSGNSKPCPPFGCN